MFIRPQNCTTQVSKCRRIWHGPLGAEMCIFWDFVEQFLILVLPGACVKSPQCPESLPRCCFPLSDPLKYTFKTLNFQQRYGKFVKKKHDSKVEKCHEITGYCGESHKLLVWKFYLTAFETLRYLNLTSNIERLWLTSVLYHGIPIPINNAYCIWSVSLLHWKPYVTFDIKEQHAIVNHPGVLHHGIPIVFNLRGILGQVAGVISVRQYGLDMGLTLITMLLPAICEAWVTKD